MTTEIPLKLISKDSVIHRFLTVERQDHHEFTIELKAHSSGLIYWCSHWEHIYDLEKLGQVVKSESGHHGRHDFRLRVKLLVSEEFAD